MRSNHHDRDGDQKRMVSEIMGLRGELTGHQEGLLKSWMELREISDDDREWDWLQIDVMLFMVRRILDGKPPELN